MKKAASTAAVRGAFEGTNAFALCGSETWACSSLNVEQEHDSLVELLPPKVRVHLEAPGVRLFALVEVHLDVGRKPVAYFWGDLPVKMTLGEEEVSWEDVAYCTDHVGPFGPDNRAGIDRTLHRISAMRDNQGTIFALTLRVGRAVTGNVDMMRDVLLDSSENLLFLGAPGTGKTTVIREATRVLAEGSQNVVIVDTSNEIGGDGVVPHRSVGSARRMMVSHPRLQQNVLVECVQNHTPEVIVVDELGRKEDVEAVSTVEKRGVRIIASAHGDLVSLVHNKQLNALVGGVSTNVVGDVTARTQNKGKKELSEQSHRAIFKHVVELTANKNVWIVHRDVNSAVRNVLSKKKLMAQRRSRNEDSTDITLEVVAVEPFPKP